MEKILLVDDCQELRDGMRRALRDEPFQLITADCARTCLEILDSVSPIVVISDLRMPGVNGAELLNHLRLTRPDVVRIALSGELNLDSTLDLVNRCNVFRCIEKPCDAAMLREAIDSAIKHYYATTQTKRLMGLARMQENYIRFLESGNDSHEAAATNQKVVPVQKKAAPTIEACVREASDWADRLDQDLKRNLAAQEVCGEK